MPHPLILTAGLLLLTPAAAGPASSSEPFGGFVQTAQDWETTGDEALPGHVDLISLEFAHAIVEGLNETLVFRFKLREIPQTTPNAFFGVRAASDITCQHGNRVLTAWGRWHNGTADADAVFDYGSGSVPTLSWADATNSTFYILVPVLSGCQPHPAMQRGIAYGQATGPVDCITGPVCTMDLGIPFQVPPLAPGRYDVYGAPEANATVMAAANATRASNLTQQQTPEPTAQPAPPPPSLADQPEDSPAVAPEAAGPDAPPPSPPASTPGVGITGVALGLMILAHAALRLRRS